MQTLHCFTPHPRKCLEARVHLLQDLLGEIKGGTRRGKQLYPRPCSRAAEHVVQAGSSRSKAGSVPELYVMHSSCQRWGGGGGEWEKKEQQTPYAQWGMAHGVRLCFVRGTHGHHGDSKTPLCTVQREQEMRSSPNKEEQKCK